MSYNSMLEWSSRRLKMLVSEPNHARAIVDDLPAIFIDPANWEWNDRSVWKFATKNWQDFKAKWYGARESASLVDPKSTSLSLDPLPPYVDGALPSILVRKSYVTMFDHVWARAMSSEGETGTIITGQPGIGAYLLSDFTIAKDKSCLKARLCSSTTSLFGFCSTNKSCSFPWMARVCSSSTMIKSIRPPQRRLLTYNEKNDSLNPSYQPFYGRYSISKGRKNRRHSWSSDRVCQCRQLHRIHPDTRHGIRNRLLCSPACRYGPATSSSKGTPCQPYVSVHV